jgi:hypothetical protein
MEWDEPTPEQQKQVEADHVDFERQLARVAVDLRAASFTMNEIEPPQRSEITGDEGEESCIESFTVDVSGIRMLDSLRRHANGLTRRCCGLSFC